MRHGAIYQTALRDPPGGAGALRTPCLHARRRRWSSRDVHELERWAGMRSMSDLSRALRRSERALRCKLQRLGMSAKVNDGWGLAQLRTELHLSPRNVLREVSRGRLCMQSAEVRTSGSLLRADGDIAPLSASLGSFATSMQLTGLRVCKLALEGRWRVVHLRISDASVHQFCHYGLLGERAEWLSPALRWWLAPVVMHNEDAVPSDKLPRHLRTMHLCPECGRQVRGNAYFRHASSHRRAVTGDRASTSRPLRRRARKRTAGLENSCPFI